MWDAAADGYARGVSEIGIYVRNGALLIFAFALTGGRCLCGSQNS